MKDPNEVVEFSGYIFKWIIKQQSVSSTSNLYKRFLLEKKSQNINYNESSTFSNLHLHENNSIIWLVSDCCFLVFFVSCVNNQLQSITNEGKSCVFGCHVHLLI